MPEVREQATLSSKGQVTLPKAIRQILGVSTGEKLSFEVREGEVIVTRAGAGHDDPAISAFLAILERDIRSGQHVGDVPEDLARALLANLDSPMSGQDEDIEGEVAL